MKSPSLKEAAIGTAIATGLLFGAHSLFEKKHEETTETAYKLRECSDDLGKMGCLDLVRVYVEPNEDVLGTEVIQSYEPSAIKRAAEILEEGNGMSPQEVALYGGIVGIVSLLTCSRDIRRSLDPKY